MKKVTPKRKSKSFIFIFILFLLILSLAIYSYISFNDQYLKDISTLTDIEADVLQKLPSEVSSNLDFLVELDENISIKYETSNEDIITNGGIVNRPSYLSGDVVVEIIVYIEIKPDNPFANIYYNILGGVSKSLKISIKVLKQEPSTTDKLNIVKDLVYIPKITKTDILLPSNISLFPGTTIVWESADESIISDLGVVKDLGKTSLTAKIKLNDEEINKTFEIEVVAGFSNLIEVFEDFENFSIDKYYDTVDEETNFIVKQAIIASGDSKVLKLKATENSEIEYKKEVSGLMRLSFSYYAITSNAFKKDVYLYIQTSIDNTTWTIFESIKITDNNVHLADFDLSSLEPNVKIKIVSYADYSEMFLAIDDLKLERKLNSNDIEKEMNLLIPKHLSSSFIFPTSSPFGGKIFWESNNDEVLTSEGVVFKKESLEEVLMTARIMGVLDEFSLVFKINVGSSTPVEIFFIDIGKYGDSDTGESIYFKIGNLDILVDAGDNREDTKKAIGDIINANSNDKIIDYVIATHPDADHIGGMKYIFDTYEILNIIYFEGTHTTQIYQNFAAAISNENLVSECSIMDSYNNKNGCKRIIELAPSIKIEFLNTGFYETAEPNGKSIVFIFEAYGKRLLMTGDADNGSGRNLEASYMNQVGNIDFLKVVHHGTREGTTIAFLEAVDPEYAIITNGNYFGNKHGHPTSEAINRIYKYDNTINIYAVVGGDSLECSSTTSYKCTVTDRFVDRNGTIKLYIDEIGFSFTAEYSDVMIELSKTRFWKTHPAKEYEHLN